MTLEDRFWKKVNKTKGCWTWIGCINPGGYGGFGFNGKREYAHRVSYLFAYGKIPHGLCVCHSCDNRKCVNPKHLWLGTVADNLADAYAKGRTIKGEDSKKSKLKTSDVLQIKALLNEGALQRVLAKEYDVSTDTIGKIYRRETWSWLKPMVQSIPKGD